MRRCLPSQIFPGAAASSSWRCLYKASSASYSSSTSSWSSSSSYYYYYYDPLPRSSLSYQMRQQRRRQRPNNGSLLRGYSFSSGMNNTTSTFLQHPPEDAPIIQVERVDMLGLNHRIASSSSSTSTATTTNDPAVTGVPSLLVLTHAHQVSDLVLRRQLNCYYKEDQNIPTIAVELTRSINASSLDPLYMILSEFLSQHTDLPRSFRLDGLPKSGKSTLALLAGRLRRLAVKRPLTSAKKTFDYSLILPKPNITWVDYRMEAESKLPDMRPMTLWDPPSTHINQLETFQEPLRTMLQAAGCLPTVATKQSVSKQQINGDMENNKEENNTHEMEQLQILLDAIQRHAYISKRDPYFNRIDAGITTASEFWNHIQEEQRQLYEQQVLSGKHPKKRITILTLPQLIRSCREGTYGPLLFETKEEDTTTTRRDNNVDTNDGRCPIQRGKAVVACNDAAMALLDRANRTKKAQSRVAARAKKAAADAKLHPTMKKLLPLSTELPNYKVEQKDSMDDLPVIRFPSHRRNFACMVCANFIKRGEDEHVYGCGHTKILTQRYDHILAYFSRMTEAFGASRRVRYLMKDSLACTLMRKHKLRSRAAAYKKFRGIKEFPMPNRLRPIYLRSDKPIPFVPQCVRVGSGRWTSCYDVLAAKLLDKIPNYQARANAVAHQEEMRMATVDDDIDDEDVY